MISVLSQKDVSLLVIRQLETFCSPLQAIDIHLLMRSIDMVYPRLEKNFANSSNKYFVVYTNDGWLPRFDPFHSVQWMTFLYYLSHELYLQQSNLCDKVYYLNKIMNSVDLFYAIELPDIWSAEHPLSSVMGRAKYSNGFFFYQGCTVGGTRDRENNLYYPVIEENVRMYANSSILGHCHIGRNVQIGAGALVKNQDVPADSIVFGQSPNIIIKTAH